jgi:hypothetical protein
MTVKPVLGDWEIPRIAAIQSIERRAFAELATPGRVGSLFQDMNRAPTVVAIRGSLYGNEARDEFLNEVRSRFKAGAPVTFVADIVTATDVQYVIIETLHFQENGVRPDQTDYLIVLRESPPPPPPPDPLGGLDAGLLDQAGSFLDSVSGALDLIEGLGNIPDIGDPTPQVRAALDQVRSATTGLQTAATLFASLFEA